MIDWSVVDSIYPDDERFIPFFEALQIKCDSCSQTISTFPAYRIDLIDNHNSIDFCSSCFYNPIHIEINPSYISPISAWCLFCETSLGFDLISNIRISNDTSFCACFDCLETDPEDKIRSMCSTLTVDSVIVNRLRPIVINIGNVQRIIPPEMKDQLTTKDLVSWVSFVEDIISIPRDFGSIKQWCIYKRKEWNNCQLNFIVDCSEMNSGRVGVLISDTVCRAIIIILYSSYDKYKQSLIRGSKFNKLLSQKQIQWYERRARILWNHKKYEIALKFYLCPLWG